MKGLEGKKSKLLVLHGNRQTGELLLGRLKKLERKLLSSKNGSGSSNDDDIHIEMIAPDAPFQFVSDREVSDDDHLFKTWWNRSDNDYVGLEDSLTKVHQLVQNEERDKNSIVEGILGFSQGARFAHFLAVLHSHNPTIYFPNLRYIIFVSGYDTEPPYPINFPLKHEDILGLKKINVPSLHVIGLKDQLVLPHESRALMSHYENPILYEHQGNHYVPMKAQDTQTMTSFIQSALLHNNIDSVNDKQKDQQSTTTEEISLEQTIIQPDEEHNQIQIDECESLSLIFTEEFKMISTVREIDEFTKEYDHPIQYSILLQPEEGFDEDEPSKWPKRNISISVTYPPMYPDVSPQLSLHHDMNLLEFKLSQSNACLSTLQDTAASELGMPCIMSCVYALRDFIESGGLLRHIAPTAIIKPEKVHLDRTDDQNNHTSISLLNNVDQQQQKGITLSMCSKERIKECNLQGLQIASSLLGHPFDSSSSSKSNNDMNSSKAGEGVNTTITNLSENDIGCGGTWSFTVGLVGKPSAGKSTVFNAATAFARQRGGDGDDGIGGATMAPHPFTTIDPNVGYCLVPAPHDSCPEDKCYDSKFTEQVGCTHGRDSKGRRLIPVILKDVAGLVPGAYQGRGRGNKVRNCINFITLHDVNYF